MKKLMIIAAAALCATAFADIESANTVGYVETPVQGFKMITPSFKNISSETYPIDNFIVKGATDGKATIQILDDKGQVVGSYYWYNEFEGLPAGWFDVTGLESAAVELKPGEAVFFYTDEEGVSLLSAGEVPGEIVHDVEGFAMLGNGSPVKINVDSMSIGNATDGKTTIQVLDEKGLVSGSYYWYNEFQDGAEVYPAGWFDVTGLESAGLELNPGDSVLFYTDESGVTVSVPSAIVEK